MQIYSTVYAFMYDHQNYEHKKLFSSRPDFYLAYNFYYVTKVKHIDIRTHCLCLKKKKTALAAVLEHLFSNISLALSRDVKQKL